MNIWNIYFAGIYLFLGYVFARQFEERVMQDVLKEKPLGNVKRMKIAHYIACMLMWFPIMIICFIYGYVIYPLFFKEGE